MNIGEKIRAARMSKGMTQEELGEILGVQKSAIAKYESGRVVNIKRSSLKTISAVLDIPPAELISEEVKKPTVQDDRLSEGKQQLIDFAKSVPEDKIDLVLKIMKSIVEAD